MAPQTFAITNSEDPDTQVALLRVSFPHNQVFVVWCKDKTVRDCLNHPTRMGIRSRIASMDEGVGHVVYDAPVDKNSPGYWQAVQMSLMEAGYAVESVVPIVAGRAG